MELTTVAALVVGEAPMADVDQWGIRLWRQPQLQPKKRQDNNIATQRTCFDFHWQIVLPKHVEEACQAQVQKSCEAHLIWVNRP